MKTKYVSKILGFGLSAGLVFASIAVLFASPVAADEMEWGKVTTPSWEDNVIVPGSDIYDYAVGPDGDTIVALGAISSAYVEHLEPNGDGIHGLSGGFYFHSGEITITQISADVAEIVGEFTGDACYLDGDFTVCGGAPGFDAALTGTITGHPDPGNGDDVLEFSGMLYGYTLGDYEDLALPAGELCVNDWMLMGEVDGFSEFWGIYTQPRAWKSDDGGVTWSDITADVQDASNLPGPFIQFAYGGVAIAPDDEDWLVIAGTVCDASGFYDGDGPNWFPPIPGIPAVVASEDGGSGFSYAGDMYDSSHDTWMDIIMDVAVAPLTDDIHNIAVAGVNDVAGITPEGTVFRLEAGTWLTGAWEDTSFYDGWDDNRRAMTPDANAIFTIGVNEVEFSTNFDQDVSILFMGISYQGEYDDTGPPPAWIPTGPPLLPYLQSGIWESGGSWNGEAGFADAVEINDDGVTLWAMPGLNSMGLALPADYDGSDPGDRSVFCYVDAYHTVNETVGGWVFRIDDDAVSPTCGPSGDPLLASMDVHGDADTGKMMVGTYMVWDNVSGSNPGDPVPFYDEPGPCGGVAVYHTEELDFCCPQWDAACKDPSGPYTALVTYTPDGDKAYATTSGAMDILAFDGEGLGDIEDFWGGWSDESAFSVSLDDGVSFNQLGLIDTDIDYLSDMAVCPDCGVIYMSTINHLDEIWCCGIGELGAWVENEATGEWAYCASRGGYWEEVCEDVWEFVCPATEAQFYKVISQVASCDSVWRSYDDGDTWERVYHGDWSEDPDDALLLRLPCDDLEECCTVYMGIQNTTDLYYTRDCGQCWSSAQRQKIAIQDIAIESEDTVYVLNSAGEVSKSTQWGRRPADEVDTGTDSGHTIAACCAEGLVAVGGTDGDSVAFSEDGGDSWTSMDDIGETGEIHVVCDTLCDGIIYAAVSGSGIYRGTVDDGAWEDLNAMPYNYYGIVLGRSDGTLYAATNEINVDTSETFPDECADRIVEPTAGMEVYSGVARNLTPCETDCCGEEDWDYLFAGLDTIDCDVGTTYDYYPTEWFDNEPSALRICGCTTVGTNSVLYAIDAEHYWVEDGSDGTVWSYEDCAAKKGPILTSPVNGVIIGCDPCGCTSEAFVLKWQRMCLACSYDISIMDEDGNVMIEWEDEEITGDPPEFYVSGLAYLDDYLISPLECGKTYTWKVREANTETGECVHSPWSAIWEFTIAAASVDAVQLVAPENGAMGVQTANVAFSWTSVSGVTSYSIVLSPNSDLSGALASEELSSTAYNYTGTLDYSAPYFWQVTAWKDNNVLSQSVIGAFTIMEKPVPGQPPVVIEPTPAPVIEIPPAQQITPGWIYAVIAIGAALLVVVIVLIVRTRRPS